MSEIYNKQVRHKCSAMHSGPFLMKSIQISYRFLGANVIIGQKEHFMTIYSICAELMSFGFFFQNQA